MRTKLMIVNSMRPATKLAAMLLCQVAKVVQQPQKPVVMPAARSQPLSRSVFFAQCVRHRWSGCFNTHSVLLRRWRGALLTNVNCRSRLLTLRCSQARRETHRKPHTHALCQYSAHPVSSVWSGVGWVVITSNAQEDAQDNATHDVCWPVACAQLLCAHHGG